MNQTGQKIRRTLARTGTLIAIFGVVAILGLSVGRVFVRQAAFLREIETLEAEREQLLRENQSLDRQLVFVSSEAFLEQEARETFGQKRPGETVVYVSESQAEVSDGTGSSEGAGSRPQQWFTFFFPSL